VAVVRGLGDFQNIPPVLTQGGNVTSISPRIITFESWPGFGYLDSSVA
jgi:hypothetical protein